MTGYDALKRCQNVVVTEEKKDGSSFSYTTTVYGSPEWTTASYQVPWEDKKLIPQEEFPTVNLPYVHTYPADQQDYEDEYFEMRSEKDVRELLSEIFLWLSGMGEYPEILAQICPEEIVGDTDSDDDDERSKVRERTVAQVLRWILGEI